MQACPVLTTYRMVVRHASLIKEQRKSCLPWYDTQPLVSISQCTEGVSFHQQCCTYVRKKWWVKSWCLRQTTVPFITVKEVCVMIGLSLGLDSSRYMISKQLHRFSQQSKLYSALPLVITVTQTSVISYTVNWLHLLKLIYTSWWFGHL